jgi:hypothetical protein
MADEPQEHPSYLASSFIATATCLTLLTLGVIVGLLLYRRREDSEPKQLGNPYQFHGWLPPPNPQQQDPGLGMPSIDYEGFPRLEGTVTQHEEFRPRSVMRTLVIPLGQTVRLLQASDDHPWQCEVRVVNPPGSFAQFSLENGTASNTVGSVTVSAGGVPQEVTVPAGRSLFVTGNVNGVMVSITGRQVRG